MRDFVVKILVKLGLYKTAVKWINYFKEASEAKRVKKYGVETLRQADAALTECGYEMFLIFGTLLGAVRDHGFIPFDYDLDVGIVADGPTEEIHKAMKAHGLKMTRQTYIRTEKGDWITEETYNYKGVGIDLVCATGLRYFQLCLKEEIQRKMLMDFAITDCAGDM